MYFFIILTLLPSLTASTPRACNNHPSLCNTTYDAVTHLGAHNSPYLHDASNHFSAFGNQFFNTTTQLDAGVRLLTVQVHLVENSRTKAKVLRLCHTTCLFIDAGLLSDWLYTIRIWLDNNPNEVVTLVLVNYHWVLSHDLQAEYAKADIAHYGFVPSHPPNTNASWPTLGDMIDKGHRLVTFVNEVRREEGDRVPYLLREWDYIWETAYDVSTPTGFTCTPDREFNTTSIADALASKKLFFMNHLLYEHQAFGIILPAVDAIEETNSWYAQGGLGKHLERCRREVGRKPTFVLVDYASVGPAVVAVDVMNGVRGAVGRLELPVGRVVEGEGVGSRGRLGMGALVLAVGASLLMV